MNDKEKFLHFAAMDIVRSTDIRGLEISGDDLMEIYKEHPDYDAIILFFRVIPPDLLDAIARNGDDRIKAQVCSKYPLLPKTYDFLVKQAEGVRISLCYNKNVPEHIIELLLNDKIKFVRKRMQEILDDRKIKKEEQAERERKETGKRMEKERKEKEREAEKERKKEIKRTFQEKCKQNKAEAAAAKWP